MSKPTSAAEDVLRRIEALPQARALYLLDLECTGLLTGELKSLASAYRDLERENRVLREVLEHYANKDSWQKQTNISILAREWANYAENGYHRARAALAESKKE